MDSGQLEWSILCAEEGEYNTEAAAVTVLKDTAKANGYGLTISRSKTKKGIKKAIFF